MPRVPVAAAGLAALVFALVPLGAAAEVAAEKRALIVELVALSGGDAVGPSVASRFLQELRPHYAELVKDVMRAEESLHPAEREALERQLSDFDAFALSFVRHFPERIDLDAVLVEAYEPLYDRYFEQQELEQIVGFYRSPVGRKMVQVLPQLIQQGLEATVAAVEPQLMELVGLILAERRQELLQ